MAPEQARGEPVDRRADIFAVGVMLWEAATGARPWPGLPALTVLKRVLAGQFPAPRSIKPEIPVELEAIILKALAHDRRDRHATAEALQAEIEAYIETTGERLHRGELGKLVSLHFEPERARIKTIIEEQLRAPAVDAARLPIIDEPTPSGAGHLGPAARESVSDPGSPASGARRGTSSSAPGVSATTQERPQHRRGLFIPAGAFAASAAALIAVLGFSLRWVWPQASGAAPTAAAASVSSTRDEAVLAAPAPPSRTVEIRFSASPPEARMFLDDAPLAGNTFRGDLPRDGATHRLRVEAAGFVDRAESVVLDQNRSFSVVLVRKVAVAPPPVPLAPRSHGRQRTLDSANPYGR
jgi:serine/threonine-protein kinase